VTLRLDPGTLRRLDELARATDRSKAWLAAQAVRTYLDLNDDPGRCVGREKSCLRDIVRRPEAAEGCSFLGID